MDAFFDSAQYALGQSASYLFRVLSWLIPIIFRFAQTHSTTTNILGYILAAYISWKLLCHLWTIIKRILIVAVVVLVVLLWKRGLHQFISVDLPVLVQYFEHNSSLQDLWNQFLYYAHPRSYSKYYSMVLQYQLDDIRDRSMQFLASLSNQ
ncbi:LANO_0B03444g1_1 [Lachancea nothofagi CBS 11611]|uniref:LANO_0B03444g1_1 n=1 Tax=Lachancea nothofagi CBS 11611 TaxID=1266666 RepID=A0A1G4IWW7_9SACH|nr:LANO_0B03444g1_1 [Lachancea nothofagi CBS 11611]